MSPTKETQLTIDAKLTCGDNDRRAGDGCRDDVANSAPTNSLILGEENSLLLEVIIQSQHAVAQVHRWIRRAVVSRVEPHAVQRVVSGENQKLVQSVPTCYPIIKE